MIKIIRKLLRERKSHVETSYETLKRLMESEAKTTNELIVEQINDMKYESPRSELDKEWNKALDLALEAVELHMGYL